MINISRYIFRFTSYLLNCVWKWIYFFKINNSFVITWCNLSSLMNLISVCHRLASFIVPWMTLLTLNFILHYDLSYHIFGSCDELDIAGNIPVSTNFVIESSNVSNLQLPIPLLKYCMIYLGDNFEELVYQVIQVLSLKECWPPNLAMKCNGLSVAKDCQQTHNITWY